MQDAEAGEPISPRAFALAQSDLSAIEVAMALQYVETRQGAERIYRAECRGLRRPTVLASAMRRLDDFDHPLTPNGGH